MTNRMKLGIFLIWLSGFMMAAGAMLIASDYGLLHF